MLQPDYPGETLEHSASEGTPLLDFMATLGGAVPAIAADHMQAVRELDVQFISFGKRFRQPLRKWRALNLNDRYRAATVFYPFGGPDFCFPYDLFPDATDYILVGTEPCLPKLPDGSPQAYDIAGVAAALRHYLAFSYFITRDLNAHLHDTQIGGVLPLLASQIVRSGLQLFVVVPLGENPVHGLRIEFGDRTVRRRLHYYRQDVRDGWWNESSLLHRHLDRCDGFAVLLKSASYLLHEPPFEKLRGLIRDRTTTLVQDPSGVPYDVLREWEWAIDLFGRFTSDIPIFAKYDQSRLASAYRAQSPRTPLDFGFGYLNDPRSSALIVAEPLLRDDLPRP